MRGDGFSWTNPGDRDRDVATASPSHGAIGPQQVGGPRGGQLCPQPRAQHTATLFVLHVAWDELAREG